jgi:adenine-specific DNA-methyltransferase
LNRLSEIKNNGVPLGRLTKIHTGIATLADKFYIFRNPKFIGKFAKITLKNGQEFKIEKDILKKIIKASTWKNTNDEQNIYIIFPYKKINNKNSIIDEDEMQEKFPLTLNYFKNIKNDLLKRDKGKKNPVSWYAFGRSQGLDTAFGKKIITAPMNLKPKFIVCEEENTLYYAGYSIIYDGDLAKLADKLNSDDMKFFIEHTSKDYQHGYKSYAKSFIKDFCIKI